MSSNVASWGAESRLVHVTLPPGATDTCGGLNLMSFMSTAMARGALDAAAGPARASPVTVIVPFIAAGWTSQWNGNVPGVGSVTVALVPGKRPPSAPGGTTPVENDPSSAVNVWGLPPTLANRIVEPAATVSSVGSNRSDSLVRNPPGSMPSTRWTGEALAGFGCTTTMPFIFAGLMRQK